MNKNYLIATWLALLLVLAVFLAGCSGSQSSSTAAQAGVSGAATTAASSQPLYKAGDILKNPKSSSPAGILIISYDAGSDMYTRAYIYPNSDGSWGYRLDSSTDTMDRSTLEKIYTQKVTNMAVSRVPTAAPSPTATPVPVATFVSYTPPPTTVTTTTTTSGVAPVIQDISPDNGYAGTSVSITALTGYNFLSGATVQLVNSGDQTTVPATSVSVVTGSTITCTFAIPSNATAGAWDVYVTNPNGYVGKYSYGFVVHQSTSSVATTTTTSSSGMTVTSITPSTTVSQAHVQFTITGTNFTGLPIVSLTNGGQPISQNMVSSYTSTSINVWFDIPANMGGTSWTVVVNSGGTTAMLPNGLTING